MFAKRKYRLENGVDKVDKVDKQTLLRLFPFLSDKNKVLKLKIDRESLYYISIREDASRITDIVTSSLAMLNIKYRDAVLLDGFAGVGGDTLTFALAGFKKIYAVELNKTRAQYLQNNINVYELNNVSVLNRNVLEVANSLRCNVIYLDPPWGGANYKKKSKLRISISNIPLEMICNKCFSASHMAKDVDMVVLKLPINYDLEHFDKTVYGTVEKWNLKKMIIVVVVNPKYGIK